MDWEFEREESIINLKVFGLAGGVITKIGNMGIRVCIKNSGLGMLSSKYLLAIQGEMLSQL